MGKNNYHNILNMENHYVKTQNNLHQNCQLVLPFNFIFLYVLQLLFRNMNRLTL